MALSKEEIKEIAEEVARAAVRETLTIIGVDHTDPRAMQADFQHLRAWRESTEAVKKKFILTAVGVLVTGALGWLWLAISK